MRRYHSIARRSRKNPPLGPSLGSVASHAIVSAPSRGDRGAEGPPMSVRTHPGSTALIRTPSARYVSARILVNAFTAVFDIEYAGAYADILASCPAPEDTFTTRPYRARAIAGTNARQTSIMPNRFASKVR